MRAVVRLHEPLAARFGVPPPVVLFVFCLVAMVTAAALLVGCAVAVGPKRQRGAAHAHAE